MAGLTGPTAELARDETALEKLRARVRPSTAFARKDIGTKIRKVGVSAQEAVKEGTLWNASPHEPAPGRRRSPSRPPRAKGTRPIRRRPAGGPRTAAEELPCEGPAPTSSLGSSCGPTSTRCFRPHADRGTQIAAEGAAAPSTWGRPELTRFAAPPAEHTWTAQLLWLLEGTAHKQCGGLPGLQLGLNLARSFTRIFRAVNRRIFSFFLEPSTLNPAHEISPNEMTRSPQRISGCILRVRVHPEMRCLDAPTVHQPVHQSHAGAPAVHLPSSDLPAE